MYNSKSCAPGTKLSSITDNITNPAPCLQSQVKTALVYGFALVHEITSDTPATNPAIPTWIPSAATLVPLKCVTSSGSLCSMVI